jgi:hypothetical protein
MAPKMNQIPLSKAAGADNHKADEARNDRTRGLSADLAYCQIAIVNVLFFGLPGAGDGAWVLMTRECPGRPPTSGPPLKRGLEIVNDECHHLDARAF